jgi:fermentation-respiration switch protein FrsA (DUF1100 family)
MMQRVSFQSGGETLVGNLYGPAEDGPYPGVVILGPETFQKEQAPTEYARRLGNLGFVSLAFDPRYRGESGGEPRCWENPIAKVGDAIAAVGFLSELPQVDAERIVALAICQGSSEMLRAAADDSRIRVLATVAGHYRDHEGDLEWLTEDGYAKRLAAGERAKRRYEETGAIDYIPGVSETDMNVGMPGKFVWDWYHAWADRGAWDNRYAVMSDADLLGYESISAAGRLTKPWLMVHSDQCFLPNAARRHFDAAPSATKELSWQGDTPHLAFYDHPEVIDSTVEQIARFYGAHLAATDLAASGAR